MQFHRRNRIVPAARGLGKALEALPCGVDVDAQFRGGARDAVLIVEIRKQRRLQVRTLAGIPLLDRGKPVGDEFPDTAQVRSLEKPGEQADLSFGKKAVERRQPQHDALSLCNADIMARRLFKAGVRIGQKTAEWPVGLGAPDQRKKIRDHADRADGQTMIVDGIHQNVQTCAGLTDRVDPGSAVGVTQCHQRQLNRLTRSQLQPVPGGRNRRTVRLRDKGKVTQKRG